MYLGQSGFWQGIPDCSVKVASMQHSTLFSNGSGDGFPPSLQMLSSSLSGGSDSYSIPTASKLKAALPPSKLFPLRKLHGAQPEGSGPAWGRSSKSRYPFLACWRYGGVGAVALPLEYMIYKHNSEANEDEDMNLQVIPVCKNM